MVYVVAIWWKIAKGSEKEFLNKWKDEFTVEGEKRNGLVGEFLSVVDPPNSSGNTWDLTEEVSTTFINVGIWRSKDDFDRAVPPANRQKVSFEKNDRRRALLNPIMWRIGRTDLRTLAEGVVTVEGTSPHNLPVDWAHRDERPSSKRSSVIQS